MFEEYLEDAHCFIQLAQESSRVGDESKARRYYRASVISLASAMESFVNYVADSFAKANALPSQEVAYLNDKALVFSPDKGEVIERVDYHAVDSKLKVILKRFAKNYDFQDKSWSWFLAFKSFRDSLVHPKQFEDEYPILNYEKELQKGLSGTINVMNAVSRSVFKKPLKKRLLDLVPD